MESRAMREPPHLGVWKLGVPFWGPDQKGILLLGDVYGPLVIVL